MLRQHKMSYKELELAIEKGERPKEHRTRRCPDQGSQAGLKGAAMFRMRSSPLGTAWTSESGRASRGGPARGVDARLGGHRACNEADVTMVLTGQRAFKH